jgi:hypothetical protein
MGLIYSSPLGIVGFTVLEQFFDGVKGGGGIRKSFSCWWSIWNISLGL